MIYKGGWQYNIAHSRFQLQAQEIGNKYHNHHGCCCERLAELHHME